MSLIHPAQIEEVNKTFTPGPEEIDYCKRVVQSFDEAHARGEGAIAFGGQLLDKAIVDRARQTLALGGIPWVKVISNRSSKTHAGSSKRGVCI